MSQPFTGEIRIFAGTYAPRNWALCNGTILSIAGKEDLFSLLGTAYGGDGRSSFGLPDMRGRLPVHFGAGPGLTPIPIGASYGKETVVLTSNQIPSHNHPMQASLNVANATAPADNVLAKLETPDSTYKTSPDPTTIKNFSSQATGNVGENAAHNNMMPYQCLNYIICIVGIYPSRN